MVLMKRLAGGAAMTALAMALSVAAAHAQETTGAIRGQVTDQGGRPVGGATVTVLHVPTGGRQTTVTTGDGYYSSRGLLVGGPYRVTVSAPGADNASVTIPGIGAGEPWNGVGPSGPPLDVSAWANCIETMLPTALVEPST